MTRVAKMQLKNHWENKVSVTDVVFEQLSKARSLCTRRSSKLGLDALPAQCKELDALCRAETVEKNFEAAIREHIENSWREFAQEK